MGRSTPRGLQGTACRRSRSALTKRKGRAWRSPYLTMHAPIEGRACEESFGGAGPGGGRESSHSRRPHLAGRKRRGGRSSSARIIHICRTG